NEVIASGPGRSELHSVTTYASVRMVLPGAVHVLRVRQLSTQPRLAAPWRFAHSSCRQAWTSAMQLFWQLDATAGGPCITTSVATTAATAARIAQKLYSTSTVGMASGRSPSLFSGTSALRPMKPVSAKRQRTPTDAS